MLAPSVSELNEMGKAHHIKFELYTTFSKLDKSDFEACLKLIKKTSGKDYEASSIGWHESSKKSEMRDSAMIYVLVRRDEPVSTSQEAPLKRSVKASSSTTSKSTKSKQSKGSKKQDPVPVAEDKILGFMSYKYDVDDPPNQNRPVVYLYEIHLETQLRGRYVGTMLLRFLDKVAHGAKISKIMLTVFKSNKGARAFYEGLGYTEDECSPEGRVTRNGVIAPDYLIMSKKMA